MTYDDTTPSISAAGVTSHTFSHTTGAGSDRLMLLSVGIPSGTDRITAATYNGVAMTRADFRSAGVGVYWYLLYAPAAGTNDIVLNFNAATQAYCQCHTFEDAPQTGVPSSTAGGGNGFQNSPRSDAITTPSGGIAVGAIFAANNMDFVASGGTELGTEASDASRRLETQYLADATAIAWTWASGSRNMAATVLALPAGGGGGGGSSVGAGLVQPVLLQSRLRGGLVR
jgi:hypothetical protein